ncbi:MAG: TetR/AcrR family transcriptional regulator [Actinomycetaceae bacterium]|nr:TetR/AcrR family transcriptional regulator [Actinomycetaceae bacterium]
MPKIIGTNLSEHREKVREQLFEALAKLLAQRAFESLTMAEIAKAAGVGRTAVYNHFPDKEALLLEFIEHETHHYTQTLESALADVKDPAVGIRVYIRSQLELGATYRLAPGRDLRRVVSSETGRKLHVHGARIEQILRSLFDQLIASGTIPAQNVDILISLYHATLAGRPLPTEPVAREYIILSVQNFLLRAIGLEDAVVDLSDFTPMLGEDGKASIALSELGIACPIHN